jgi:hypothetical protein
VEFPEVAAIARTIQAPRLYVPAPPPARASVSVAPSVPLSADEPPTLVEPAPARIREAVSMGETPRPPAQPVLKPSDAPPPPPLVDPGSVKYDP